MSYLNSDSDSGPDNNSPQRIVVDIPLKLNIHDCSDSSIDLSAQNKLAFDIADTFSHVESSVERGLLAENSAQNRLLEKKLNLIIQLLNTLLVNLGDSATVSPIKLSAQTIEWDSSQFQTHEPITFQKDQNLLFDFYPASELPYPIKRCGVVVDVKDSVICAQFYPLDKLNQERFEKWVFQLHRRSVQKKSAK